MSTITEGAPATGGPGPIMARGAAALAGAAGMATWVRHGAHFADVGADSVGELIVSTTGPGFPLAFGVGLALLAGLQLLAGRLPEPGASRIARPLATTACAGMALPLGSLLLDPVSFRCTAGHLGLLGTGLILIRAAALPWPRHESRSRSRILLVVAVLAATVPLVRLPGWPGASGDEPHYLILSQSIYEDGDLDLAREHAERDHRDFWLPLLSPHTKPGKEPGTRYSMHGVGLALVTTPAFAIAERVDPGAVTTIARGMQILVYALFGVVLYLATRAVAGPRAALRSAALSLPLLPLVVTPLAIFPELWAMLAACLAFLLLRAPTRTWHAVAGGTALAALPWLGVKLLPLAGILAVGATLRAGGELSRSRIATAVWTPLVLSLAGHGAFTWALYGSLSPMAIYFGAVPEAVRAPALGSDWWAYVQAWPGALRTFFGHLLDQKDGLLAVAPHYLLAALGIPWMWRNRRADLLLLTGAYLAHALPYALSHELGGQSPPARPLIPVTWVLAILLGIGLARPLRRWAAAVAGALVALSGWLTVQLVSNPELLSHDYSVHLSRLLLSLSSPELALWEWFPLWVNYARPQWGVTLLWTLGAAALGIALSRAGSLAPASGSGSRPSPSPVARVRKPSAAHGRLGARAVGHLGAGLALATVILATMALEATVPVPAGHEGGEEVAPGIEAWVPGGYPRPAWVEPGSVWVRPGEPTEVVLRADRPLGPVRVALRTLVATDVFFALGDTRIAAGLPADDVLTADVEEPNGRRDGDRWTYRLLLGARRGAAPAQVHGGMDYRVLGVNLRLASSPTPSDLAAAGPTTHGPGR